MEFPSSILVQKTKNSTFLIFDYPEEAKETSKSTKFTKTQVNSTIFFKAYKNIPFCIEGNIEQNGCVRTSNYTKANIIWKLINQLEINNFIKELRPNCRYNHFPCTWELGRKDRLWSNFDKFRKQFPLDYNFVPQSYLLPQDREAAEAAFNDGVKLILKPVASSRGRGVRLINDWDSTPKKTLISHYITNPHIINDKKYDLRLYVLVSSYTPLKIYLHKQGLVRFASQNYELSDKTKFNRYVHLTNYSINKTSSKFNANYDFENACLASKWSMFAYEKYFKEQGLSYEALMSEIKDILIKTIIMIAEQTAKKVTELSCEGNKLFEVYGFDVIIDENIRPWLLEVNLNPSLSCDSEMDTKVKSMMISDALSVAGMPIEQGDREDLASEFEYEKARSGNFENIFPKKNAIKYYAQFLEGASEKNAELWNELDN